MKKVLKIRCKSVRQRDDLLESFSSGMHPAQKGYVQTDGPKGIELGDISLAELEGYRLDALGYEVEDAEIVERGIS